MESLLKDNNFDAACFHAPQAAEKYLKAFLLHHGTKFPFTHNLKRLVELCEGIDASSHSHG